MSVRVRIFYPRLRDLIDQPGEVRVNGQTVGDCLQDLVARFPDARELIFDREGRLQRHVYVYVNADSLHRADPARPVTEKDELLLAVLATAG